MSIEPRTIAATVVFTGYLAAVLVLGPLWYKEHKARRKIFKNIRARKKTYVYDEATDSYKRSTEEAPCSKA